MQGHQDRRPVPFGTKISCRTGPSARPGAATLAAVPSGAGRGAWREHDETSRRRADLAEIVQRGVHEGTFGLQVPSEDLTICSCALLDGLAMIQLNQRPYLSRARLIELAMATARAQLARNPAGLPSRLGPAWPRTGTKAQGDALAPAGRAPAGRQANGASPSRLDARRPVRVAIACRFGPAPA